MLHKTQHVRLPQHRSSLSSIFSLWRGLDQCQAAAISNESVSSSLHIMILAHQQGRSALVLLTHLFAINCISISLLLSTI